MTKINKLLFFTFIILLSAPHLYAQEMIYLKNGDRLSGSVTEEMNNVIVFNTQFLGTVNINKEVIEKIISSEAPEKKALEEAEIIAEWTREFEAGYNLETGNTEKDSSHIAGIINRKTDKTETTLKGNANQSSSNNKMDDQKWYTLARFAYSFGKKKNGTTFLKMKPTMTSSQT